MKVQVNREWTSRHLITCVRFNLRSTDFLGLERYIKMSITQVKIKVYPSVVTKGGYIFTQFIEKGRLCSAESVI